MKPILSASILTLLLAVSKSVVAAPALENTVNTVMTSSSSRTPEPTTYDSFTSSSITTYFSTVTPEPTTYTSSESAETTSYSTSITQEPTIFSSSTASTIFVGCSSQVTSSFVQVGFNNIPTTTIATTFTTSYYSTGVVPTTVYVTSSTVGATGTSTVITSVMVPLPTSCEVVSGGPTPSPTTSASGSDTTASPGSIQSLGAQSGQDKDGAAMSSKVFGSSFRMGFTMAVAGVLALMV